MDQARSYPAATHVDNTAVVVGVYSEIGPYLANSVEINVTGGGCPSATPTATATATTDTNATRDIYPKKYA